MIIWGFISILTGLTHEYVHTALLSLISETPRSFVGALLTRFFLGFVEAAFFPGALFLISKWYKRSELGERTALLACGMLISNAFGALIASGILDAMDGKFGRAAWRYDLFPLYHPSTYIK
jgi:MFS family permease